MIAAPPLADHQPLVVPEGDEYRPACLCGWDYGCTFELRAEALALAYSHDRRASTLLAD